MESKTTPHFFILRYADYTLDVVALFPDEIQKVRDMKGVNDMIPMGDNTELALDRDYLIGTKKLKDVEDDD